MFFNNYILQLPDFLYKFLVSFLEYCEKLIYWVFSVLFIPMETLVAFFCSLCSVVATRGIQLGQRVAHQYNTVIYEERRLDNFSVGFKFYPDNIFMFNPSVVLVFGDN